MLPQDHMMARVRELCQADDRLVAALTYGSFAQGTGDAFSDIEFWLFFADPSTVDPRAWIDRVGGVRHVVLNEFGSHVAFLPGLIRGEFHFAAAADITSVTTWPARSAPVDRMIVLDRTGALRQALTSLPDQPRLPETADEIEQLCGRFANWLVLAHHVRRRGELLRAVDALSHAQRHLLWLGRLADRSTEHWLTPSRCAESDLDADTITALHATVPTADPADIDRAIAAAWALGRRCWQQLSTRTGRPIPADLCTDLDAMSAPDPDPHPHPHPHPHER
ncbi:hypothetical protein [Catellatospora tritici]|uniref:hypothetical protein n=1 Tax=Catellatospora tritici TaxID=2851566 RepID=UPI001C2D32CE|nr:hypothetical protein [Catellatospora tritici]MBV1852677.1 hypothetical protein [Catellatospora tritici]